MKLNSWRGIGSDGDVLLTPYVPEGITGYDDDDDDDDYKNSSKLSNLKMMTTVTQFVLSGYKSKISSKLF